MDAPKLISETYDEEDPDEQIRPSKRLKSSESINPGHDGSTPSSPPMDALASVREMYENVDPDEQIDRLVRFVENQLQKMITPSEAGSSSSEGWLDTVSDSTELAAKTIDIISTEAEKISNSDALKNVTLNVMKGLGDSFWMFIGLSVAAYAVKDYLSVGSTEKEYREILLNILELAKDVKRMSDVKEMLSNAVASIVEGAVIFCDYMNLERGKICRDMKCT